MAEITLVLERLNRGDREALDELVTLVYQELKHRAAGHAADHGHTLQTTALVNEALAKLLAAGLPQWQNSKHFYNTAAEVIRQVVLNHHRARIAQKRAAAFSSADLADIPASQEPEIDFEALDLALTELSNIDQRRYQVVMLRYFAGRTDAQVAAALGVSEKTVERDWAAAKLFLRAYMMDHNS